MMNRRDEIENLNEAMRETSNKRLYERYLAVRLHLEGHMFAEIGTLLNCAYQTISRYWATYRENGLEGLELDHSPGKPVKLTDEQLDKLANTVEKKQPADVGFEAHYTGPCSLLRTGLNENLSNGIPKKAYQSCYNVSDSSIRKRRIHWRMQVPRNRKNFAPTRSLRSKNSFLKGKSIIYCLKMKP